MLHTPRGPRPFHALLSLFAGSLALIGSEQGSTSPTALTLDSRGCLTAPGLDVLVFSNAYEGLFSDAKISGVELIHHDVRTVTNGDVRLNATPTQWDPIPALLARRTLPEENAIEADLEYKEHNFRFTLRAQAEAEGFRLSVKLGQPLPPALVGKAGLNLEFLPSAYFRKTFATDTATGVIPLHPASAMKRLAEGGTEPLPLAQGASLVLAPEDPARRVVIRTEGGASVALHDGRTLAQNGWLVARTLLPEGRTGEVVTWHVTPSRIQGWIRPTVIGHSQVGYHPLAPKLAVIETDPRHRAGAEARLLRINEDGSESVVLSARPRPCAPYLRYGHLSFDFSAARKPGIHVLEYDGVRTKAFRIAPDVYRDAWHPSLDVFLPVQMDHMFVREAYRVWHGDSHKDDARQAPPDHEHFDLYRQGAGTDTRFAAGEHIPGLNIGGWYDAGDFDIRTQTQYSLVISLVQTWEDFKPLRDQTSVNQVSRHVELHKPDGVPDIIQQIEHGALALLAQHRAVGHAIHGIVEPDLVQYTHLGDGSTKTDNLVHDPKLRPGEVRDGRSGTPDDRWAFTTRSTPLNYGSIAALAAASRALAGWRDELAAECRATALRVWDEEHSHAPYLFSHGNTTGGKLSDEEFKAACELLRTTGEQRFAQRVGELLGEVGEHFGMNAVQILRALPQMDKAYAERVEKLADAYVRQTEKEEIAQNPYRVPITLGSWAGNGRIIHQGIVWHHLLRSFPGKFDYAPFFALVDYLYGNHPGSDLSMVSAVGTASKEVAYGNNRADFSYIAGGVVPGVLVIKPDYPENKEDWPFFWGQNEYVVNLGGTHIYLAHAAQAVSDGLGK